MGVNYYTDAYCHTTICSRELVTFYLIKAGGSYDARGIFGTVAVDIISMDTSDVSDQRTILDILEIEFATIPDQQDQVYIGPDPSGMPEVGTFEINDVATNGGGETTLTLRRIKTSKP